MNIFRVKLIKNSSVAIPFCMFNYLRQNNNYLRKFAPFSILSNQKFQLEKELHFAVLALILWWFAFWLQLYIGLLWRIDCEDIMVIFIKNWYFYFPCFFSIYMNQTEILLSNIEWISFSSKNWMRTCFHIFILKWSRTTMSKFKNDRVWYLNKSFPCYCDSNYVQILEIILEKKKQQHLCKGNSLCNCKMYSLIKKITWYYDSSFKAYKFGLWFILCMRVILRLAKHVKLWQFEYDEFKNIKWNNIREVFRFFHVDVFLLND